MKRNVAVLVAMLALLAMFSYPQTGALSKQSSGNNHEVIQKSKETWEAYKSANIAAIKTLTADDFVAHTLEGPSNLAQDIEAITTRKLRVASYAVHNPTVSLAADNVAILRYKLDLKGTFDGKPLKPAYVTEVWVNRAGSWRIVSYAETPIS
jgi:hypothetical protein